MSDALTGDQQPDKAVLREALLGQLAYLVAEVEALQTIVHRVPEAVLAGRPLPGDRTIKEMYGLLVAADETVFLPQLQRLSRGQAPDLAAPEEEALLGHDAWNEMAMEALLGRLRQGRTRLVDFLAALPAAKWDHAATLEGQAVDVYTLAHFITQHDAEWLRAVGYRLHESRLTDGPDDLPK